MKRLFLVPVALVLLACGTTIMVPEVDQAEAEREARRQRVLAWNNEMEVGQRFYNAAFAIVESNARFCEDENTLRMGIQYATLENYESEWREIARSESGITDHVTVISVAKGSPADAAGIMVGDEILRINGEGTGTGEYAVEDFHDLVKDYGEDGPLTVSIRRDGNPIDLQVVPATVCDYPFHALRSDELNAWTDGSAVFMTTAMLRFVASDDALAFILGHELAHITLGHVDRQLANTLVGALVGAIVSELIGADVTEGAANYGSQAFSQEFESEADYVGAYYSSRAGYDLVSAAEVWWKIAMEYPEAINLEGSTHPSTAIRHLAIKKTAEEINRKRAENLPLVPDSK